MGPSLPSPPQPVNGITIASHPTPRSRNAMISRPNLGTLLAIGLLVPSLAVAQAATTDAAFIKLAEGGGPAGIASKAAVARIDPAAKKVTELRPGSNGFTC